MTAPAGVQRTGTCGLCGHRHPRSETSVLTCDCGCLAEGFLSSFRPTSIPCAVVLRIMVRDGRGIDYITDALGECARDLEAFEAEQDGTPLGLVPDPDDPGRYAWSIVEERYP